MSIFFKSNFFHKFFFLAASIFFAPFFCERIFSQVDVSRTGVIGNLPFEEKVSEEDVSRLEMLDAETRAEYGEGETVAQSEEDFDALFESEEDTESAVTTVTTETAKVDEKGKAVSFGGNLKSELGGYVWLEPRDKTKPLATFRNVLRFTGRPTTDFYVTGSFLTEFPAMQFGVYELYFNYTLWGVVSLAAGKRDVNWNLSRMLDTNSLDDTRTTILIDKNDTEGLLTSIFKKRDRTTNDSRFTLSIDIPILSYASIKGVAQYYGTISSTAFSSTSETVFADFISVAGKLEGTVGKFSFSLYGIRYPNFLGQGGLKSNYSGYSGNNLFYDGFAKKETYYDPVFSATDDTGILCKGAHLERMNSVFGMEVVSSILGKQSNMFLQVQANYDKNESRKFNHAKLTTGVYKYFPAPVMLGLAAEYQLMYHKNHRLEYYDKSNPDYDVTNPETWIVKESEDFFGTGKKTQNYIAAQVSWSHFILKKKCTFGCEWFHDVENKYGALMPVVKIENIAKYTDLRFAMPVYYGSQKRYGIVFEAILNLNY